MVNTNEDLTPINWQMDTEMDEDAMLFNALKRFLRYGVRDGDIIGAENSQTSMRVFSCM